MDERSEYGTSGSWGEQNAVQEWFNRHRLELCHAVTTYRLIEQSRADKAESRLAAAEARGAKLEGLLLQCRDAFHFTREYVEPKVSLPAIPGWSWYDAVTAIDAALRGEEVRGE